MDKPEFEFETIPEIPELSIKVEVKEEEDVSQQTSQEDTSEDPLLPTLHNQVLDSQAKLMILNVHKYFHRFRILRAKETGEDMSVNAEVAKATGVSESAVKKIYYEYRKNGIELAIRPPIRPGSTKKRTNIIEEVGENLKEKKQKKK